VVDARQVEDHVGRLLTAQTAEHPFEDGGGGVLQPAPDAQHHGTVIPPLVLDAQPLRAHGEQP
jgi:hypothetical protein